MLVLRIAELAKLDLKHSRILLKLVGIAGKEKWFFTQKISIAFSEMVRASPKLNF